MKNIDLDVKGDILTIKVDLSQALGDSKSGKTIMIATSEGNKAIPGRENIKLGLNVFKGK